VTYTWLPIVAVVVLLGFLVLAMAELDKAEAELAQLRRVIAERREAERRIAEIGHDAMSEMLGVAYDDEPYTFEPSDEVWW
jgi:signal transduction histidine kinase